MIITVASFKGGVGKTTTAIHLSAYLANRKGASVALADGDRNRTAVNWAGRAVAELSFKVYPETDLPKDWNGDLVIDSAGGLSEDDLLKLAAISDLVIIPTLPTAFSIENTIDTLQRLKGLTKYRILLTAVPPKPSKAGDKAIKALDDAKLPRFKQAIARRAVFTDSELVGVPVASMSGKSAKTAWEDYQAIGKELMRYLK
jgi:chromosome partitioning protein